MNKFAAFLVVILILSTMLVHNAAAADFRALQNISIAEEEVVDEDLYMAGGNLSFAGTVEGDLLAAGGSTFISGQVSENLMVAGGSVTVVGDIGRAARIAGGVVEFSGSSVTDVVIAGSSVSVLPEASIGEDLAVFAETALVEGDILGDAEIRAREVVINGAISGNVTIETGRLTLNDGASIGGDLTYTAPQEADIDDDAVVTGEISFTEEGFTGFLGTERPTLWPFFWAGNILMTLVTALLISFIFRRQTRMTITSVANNFWQNLLRGFIVAIVVPVAIIIFAITVLGIPIAFISMLAYILFFILSFVLSGVAAGALIAKRWYGTDYIINVNWKIVIGGVLLLSLISAIPFIGWFIRAVFVLAVLGALFLMFQNAIWERREEEKTEKLIA